MELGINSADGVWEASQQIGQGSKLFAIAANGEELPMHYPRNMKGLILTYLADPTPGRHTAAGLDFAEFGAYNHFAKGLTFKNSSKPFQKGQYQARYVKYKQSFNSLGFCEFAQWMGQYPLFEMIKV